MKEGQSTVGINRAEVGTVKKEGEEKHAWSRGKRGEEGNITTQKENRAGEGRMRRGKCSGACEKCETLGDDRDAPRQRGR